MRAPTFFVSSLTLATILLAPSVARAAACCGDGGSLGQRLTRFERAALTLGPTFTERLGGWGPTSAYSGLRKGDHDRALRLDVSWVLRVTSRLELGVSVPVQAAFRSLGGTNDVGGGVGDVTALARFTAVAVDDTTPWPALFVTSAVVVPTGRPQWLGSELGANVTGQGVPELRTSASLEKAWHEKWFAQVNGAVGLLGPSDAGGVPVARRPRWSTGFVTGPIFTLDRFRGLAFGVGLAYETEAAASIAGSHLGPGRSKLSLLSSASLDLTERISLVAALRSAVPGSNTGTNETATIEVTTLARFAIHVTD